MHGVISGRIHKRVWFNGEPDAVEREKCMYRPTHVRGSGIGCVKQGKHKGIRSCVPRHAVREAAAATITVPMVAVTSMTVVAVPPAASTSPMVAVTSVAVMSGAVVRVPSAAIAATTVMVEATTTNTVQLRAPGSSALAVVGRAALVVAAVNSQNPMSLVVAGPRWLLGACWSTAARSTSHWAPCGVGGGRCGCSRSAAGDARPSPCTPWDRHLLVV
jgi:hypothetical protein